MHPWTRPLNFAIAISLTVISWGVLGFAQDKPPVVSNKQSIANAVQIEFTLRGQKFFQTNLLPIIENMGFNFNEGYFAPQTFSSDAPINMADLQKQNPEAYDIYLKGKDLLTKWFVGFTLADHRPVVAIGNSGYQATISKLSLVTDEALMKTLGKKDGAVMAVDLEISRLNVATDSIRAWDANNFAFAKFGFDDTTLLIGNEKSGLKIRLPFYIRVNSKGIIEFQALELQENFQQVPVVFKYKNLVVPKVAIEIEGHRYALNTQQLATYLDDQLPAILVQVRKYLSTFSRKQLPEILTKKAQESMAGALEQVQTITAPGQAKNDYRPPLEWGLKLASINLNTSLNIGLHAYAEDKLNPNVPLVASNLSRGAPLLARFAPDTYDIALSIDRGLINRLLQLSFLRKNFDSIPDNDGSVYKLSEAPTVDYIQPPKNPNEKEAYVKIHVSVEVQPNRPLWLDDTIVVQMDIISVMQPTGPGAMAMRKHSVDLNSIKVDTSYMTIAGKLAEALGGQVTSGVQREIANRTSGWEKSQELLADNIALPPSLYGIQLDVNKLIMDPNGHLVMYLNYSTGAKK